jgi:general secretion pathway protein M
MLARGSLLSRTLALLLLAAAILAGYRLVAAPLLASYSEADQAIERNRELLQRYRRLAAERPVLAERVGEQEALLADAAGYLVGPSDALAAAELQNRVKELVEAAEGILRSTQSLQGNNQDDAAAPARRAAVRVRFTVDIEGLAEVLYELETGEPYLFVEEVTIRELRERRRRRNEPEPKPMLDISLDVYGYLREGEA